MQPPHIASTRFDRAGHTLANHSVAVYIFPPSSAHEEYRPSAASRPASDQTTAVKIKGAPGWTLAIASTAPRIPITDVIVAYTPTSSSPRPGDCQQTGALVKRFDVMSSQHDAEIIALQEGSGTLTCAPRRFRLTACVRLLRLLLRHHQARRQPQQRRTSGSTRSSSTGFCPLSRVRRDRTHNPREFR